MGKKLSKIVLGACCLLASQTAFAQQGTQLLIYQDQQGATVEGMSPNGKWAVGYSKNANDQFCYPLLWNLETNESNYIFAEEGEATIAGAFDVADDGTVVGSYNEAPAYYKNGEWIELPLPENYNGGNAMGVSADGNVIVGFAYIAGKEEDEEIKPCKWVNYQLVDIEIPPMDSDNTPAKYNQLFDVSADGSVIRGALNYTHPDLCTPVVWCPDPVMICEDIYYYDNGDRNYTELHDPQIHLSPNGKYITGYADYDLGETNVDACFFYDVDQQKTEVYYNDPEAAIHPAGSCVDNNAVIYETPRAGGTTATATYIRIEGEQQLLNDYLLQEYNFDVTENSPFTDLGRVLAVSSDCKTLIGFAGARANNWCLKLDKVPGGYPDGIEANKEIKANVTVENGVLSVTGDVRQIILRDTAGKTILNQELSGNDISLNGVAKGIYIATLRTDGKDVIQKIIIK